MATTSHARAVKSLNKSCGRRRFVFKSFSRRIEDIEIDVFRSLEKIDSTPSEGSSFLRDSLVEWRELNTAEDFISVYEDLMPIVQTLPLVLLNKELIFSKLVSKLTMEGRLSLEPILRLIASLSRDLLEDFLIFIPQLVDSIAILLQSGGDKEPEVIEQIFTSWSYTLMYLQKYLMRDICHILKVTSRLRFYPKVQVVELMAIAISFLLRNASTKQLIKGTRKLFLEAVKKPSLIRKSSVSTLFCYVLKGTSAKLHSRAELLFPLLIDHSIFIAVKRVETGFSSITEVVLSTFEKLDDELAPEELQWMQSLLFHEIEASFTLRNAAYLSHLLSIFLKTICIRSRKVLNDHQAMFECVGSIVQKIPSFSEIGKENDILEITEKVVMLMLPILERLACAKDETAISLCATMWAPIFDLKSFSIFSVSTILTFIRGLLAKDHCVFYPFRMNILSFLCCLLEVNQEEAICLLVILCNRLNAEPSDTCFFEEQPEVMKIAEFMLEIICSGVQLIYDMSSNEQQSHMKLSTLALLWGCIWSVPHIKSIKLNSSLLWDFINAIEKLLMIEKETIAGFSRSTWQSFIGAALRSHNHVENFNPVDMGKVFRLVETYNLSLQVLSAAADYFDKTIGKTVSLKIDSMSGSCFPDFLGKSFCPLFDKFADNLLNPSKELRIQTLRVLCHNKSRGYETQRKKMDPSENHFEDPNDVLRLLLGIETTHLSVATSRSVILLISRIQTNVASGIIDEIYVPVVLCGLLGLFHNRFTSLWNATLECVAGLIKKYPTASVWNKFSYYFEKCVSSACQSQNISLPLSDSSITRDELVKYFCSFVEVSSDSTKGTILVSLLLQSLQHIPSIAESHSQELVSWFFKFLRSELFVRGSCKGKEMRFILKEWLNLFKVMRNSKLLFQSQALKYILQFRLIGDKDPEIQIKALECLLTWQDEYLLPYEHHLRNLIISKRLREELATWSLSTESSLIKESHRKNVIYVVLNILMAKVRSLKTLASRKHTSVNHRRAVLQFIAQLPPEEIHHFFSLLVKPLIDDMETDFSGSRNWLASDFSLDYTFESKVLDYFTTERIIATPWKQKYCFVHIIVEVVATFSKELMKPYLDFLTVVILRILGSCFLCFGTLNLREGSSDGNLNVCDRSNNSDTSRDVKQFKDLRSLCLKVVSDVLHKYDDHKFLPEFWDLFFTSVKPMLENFKQQTSSSEKPSGLLSCFLAMSKSYNLVPHFSRVTNVVSQIFSILSVRTASEAVISCVIIFVENLLRLDEEMTTTNGESAVKTFVLASIGELVNGVHFLFQKHMETKRKSAKYARDTYLRILKLLPKYIKDMTLAGKLLDVVLHLMSPRVSKNGLCIECLQIIREITPLLPLNNFKKIIDSVSQLLITVDLDKRLQLCDILDNLAVIDPSLLSVTKLLQQLNATSALEDDDLEYETIINAYSSIGSRFFYTVHPDHVRLVLSHCVYDLSSENFGLRGYALHSLVSFVEFSALILHETKQNIGFSKHPMAEKTLFWDRKMVNNIVKKFLLKHIGYAMRAGTSVKKEWFELLQNMVLKLPDMLDLNSLMGLCSDDAEQDFFNNIVHQQKHRRARSILRFKTIISKIPISQEIANQVFLPLFLNMLLDAQPGKDENLRNACVEAISSISCLMDWRSYHKLIVRCFKEMTMHSNKQKILSRLICAVLGQFHFCPTDIGEASDSMSKVEDLVTCGSTAISAVQKSNRISISSYEYQTQLKTLLQKVRKLLESDNDKTHVALNIAALKLLKLLPKDSMDTQLPTIMHHIAVKLKNRSEAIRDDARLALAVCLKELGPEYLQFVLGILQAVLKRGFERHVLGYSLNFILVSMSRNSSLKLDYCLDDLLTVVKNDILGDIGEEKEVDKIASKMKETKKLKSFETLEIIASSITVKTNALKLLTPVTTYMQNTLTPDLSGKLQKMLNHIAAGLESNQSLDQMDLLVFVYGLIEDGATKCCLDGDCLSKRMPPLGTIVRSKTACSYLITEFALNLFLKRVKKVRLKKNEEQILSMLDPFVQQLVYCLNSKYEDIISATIRCLIPLVTFPLPSLQLEADTIKRIMLDIAHGSLNANSSLMQSCLRLLTDLLKSTKIKLSNDHLNMLVQLPLFTDLERNPSLVALSLLRAVIKRKLVVPEVYDIMINVSELMVTSQLEPIRHKCSVILLQFLLDYRLSESYLQQHLDFLIKNLSYEYPSGREAVLEMLHVIISKFPRSLMDRQSQTIFIHLVQILANDNDSRVLSMTGAVIKQLLGVASPNVVDAILDFTLSWYIDGKMQLKSVGAQALGFLVEVMGRRFLKYADTVFITCSKILESSVDHMNDFQPKSYNNDSHSTWKEAYYTLNLLEKVFLHESCLRRDHKELWVLISNLLLHPHSWIRNVSNRLLALYFAATKRLDNTNDEMLILLGPSKLFVICASLCSMLKAQDLEDASSTLITQNLVFSVCALNSSMKMIGRLHSLDSPGLQQFLLGDIVRGFQLLEPKKGRDMYLSFISDSSDTNGDELKGPCYLLISNLLRTMGKIAVEMESSQIKVIFTSFRLILSELSSDECLQHAFNMLLPLYKVSEGYSGKIIPDDIKVLSQEVRGSIQSALGINNFAHVYEEVRKTLKTKRDKRKQDEKVMAVTNPMRAAKRKRRLAEKHKSQKKRRVMKMKFGRWMP